MALAYVVLDFCEVSETIVLFFGKKSYIAGKFTGEFEKSASSKEVTEVGMKSIKNV